MWSPEQRRPRCHAAGTYRDPRNPESCSHLARIDCSTFAYRSSVLRVVFRFVVRLHVHAVVPLLERKRRPVVRVVSEGQFSPIAVLANGNTHDGVAGVVGRLATARPPPQRMDVPAWPSPRRPLLLWALACEPTIGCDDGQKYFVHVARPDEEPACIGRHCEIKFVLAQGRRNGGARLRHGVDPAYVIRCWSGRPFVDHPHRDGLRQCVLLFGFSRSAGDER